MAAGSQGMAALHGVPVAGTNCVLQQTGEHRQGASGRTDLSSVQIFPCRGEPRSLGLITCLLTDVWDTALGF